MGAHSSGNSTVTVGVSWYLKFREPGNRRRRSGVNTGSAPAPCALATCFTRFPQAFNSGPIVDGERSPIIAQTGWSPRPVLMMKAGSVPSRLDRMATAS